MKKKIFINSFIALNIFTVLFIHISSHLQFRYSSPQIQYQFENAGWYIRRYAHFVGLDNRWEMFSYAHRFDWWFLFTAKYPTQEIPLPLPLQSQRTWLQSTFVDFKEAKFHLNIYNDQLARSRYVNYLCRRFSNFNGATIQSIKVQRIYQNLLPQNQAEQLRTHLDKPLLTSLLEEIPCPKI